MLHCYWKILARKKEEVHHCEEKENRKDPPTPPFFAALFPLSFDALGGVALLAHHPLCLGLNVVRGGY